ncbi:MAG: hypothetical protein SynsKO_34720 [Synoicihabitans sp.]
MNWPLFALVSYLLLFLAVSLGIAVVRVRKRGERPPVEFKFLRGPGETLRQRIAKFDENFLTDLGKWALAPVVVTFVVSFTWFKLTPLKEWWHLYLWGAATILVFAFSVLWGMRRVWADFTRYRSDRLGYMGERFVGEKLNSLIRDGYWFFHDIPAEKGERKFNLDHVVVGPTGLWLIETKTRRKGRAREGFEEHVVKFDGRQLIWPWGEDSHGLKQTEAECRWLKEWVERRTGIKTEPRGILTLPGWMVKEQTKADIRVLNPKNIPSAIKGRGEQVLTVQQVDLIARQLDLVCRDVES